MKNLGLTPAKDNAMIAPNKKPQYQTSSAKLVEPMSICVNMTYDPGPVTQAERMAARGFIDSVGGLERAQEVLRHMLPPLDAERPEE